LEINSGAIVVINQTLNVTGNFILNNGSLSLSPSSLSIQGCANISNSSILVKDNQPRSPIINVFSGCLSVNSIQTTLMDDPNCKINLQYDQTTLIASCQQGSPEIANWIWIALGIFAFIAVIGWGVAIWKIMKIQKRRDKNLEKFVVSKSENFEKF